jgi:hypothetical protein
MGAGLEAPDFLKMSAWRINFFWQTGIFMMKRNKLLIGMTSLMLAMAFADCWFDLGEPMPEGQETQPEGGVFTVK